MQNIECERCKNIVRVNLYFYNERITTNASAFNTSQDYEALVYGKAICPICGKEIQKTFKKFITKEDIIYLTGGRGE